MKGRVISNRIACAVAAAVLSSSSILIAQAGSLDPAFGTGGIVTTPNTNTGCGELNPCGLAIQSDGKIVVAGGATASNGGTEVAIARYNTNGTLDTSFGSGGIVTTSQDSVSGPVFGMALQSDGKIVVAATAGLDLAVIRYSAGGSLDTTFGTGGIASLRPFNDLFFNPLFGGVAVEPNGDILVVTQAIATRLLANGQVDTSFGSTGGAAQLAATAQGLTFLPNGKFLVSTLLAPTAAARYTSNGSLDTSFGAAGQMANLGGSSIIALTNGKLIAVGSLTNSAPPPPATNTQGFAVIRYGANGVIDSTFGTRGATVTSFPNEGFSSAAAAAVQTNGDIVVGGVTEAKNPVFGSESSDFALARYTATGQLDTTFGTAGLVMTPFGTNGEDTAAISALAIQSDGKIVVVGYAFGPVGTTNNGFVLARYLFQ